MVVKRTAMGKRLQFFFTMFSTSARYIVCDDPIECQREFNFSTSTVNNLKVKHAYGSSKIILGSYEAFNDMSNT